MTTRTLPPKRNGHAAAKRNTLRWTATEGFIEQIEEHHWMLRAFTS